MRRQKTNIMKDELTLPSKTCVEDLRNYSGHYQLIGEANHYTRQIKKKWSSKN